TVGNATSIDRGIVMQTLQLVLSESQYERLRHAAEERDTSITDLVLEALEAFLRSAAAERRYARLARKQALWRAWQEADRWPQPGTPLVREQPAAYTVEPAPSVHACLADLRLDLIYHSEALEGSPLTRTQVEEAIRELSSQ
ncbi:MAG: hypothetical protein ACE5LU_21030, partial [Anaerolineae bacterium]